MTENGRGLERLVLGVLIRLITRLRGRSQTEILGLGFALVLVVAAADYATGEELAFSVFYLVPVMGTAWLESRVAAILVAIAAGAAFPISDILAGDHPAATWIPLWNFAVRSGTYLVVAELTGALRRVLELERQLARVDSLTGALNARSFVELVQREIERARRTRRPLTLAYIDLDGFKEVNDTFGHAAGDAILRDVAEVLMHRTRPSDIAGRLGGDEFAILLPETGDGDAVTPLERINEAVRTLTQRGGYQLSASIGAVTFVHPPPSPDEMLRAADDLMYEAKREGKDRIRHRVVEGAPASERSG